MEEKFEETFANCFVWLTMPKAHFEQLSAYEQNFFRAFAMQWHLHSLMLCRTAVKKT